MIRRRSIIWILLFLVSLIFCLNFHNFSLQNQPKQVLATEKETIISASKKELVGLGIEAYQQGKWPEAIEVWEKALLQIANLDDRATIHNNLALAYHQIGQNNQAIANWQKAIEIYQELPDKQDSIQLAKLLIQQAQVYSELGQQRKAISSLEKANEITINQGDKITQAAALGALGNAIAARGNYEEALSVIDESLKIAKELNNISYISTALNNQANVYMSLAERLTYQAASADVQEEDPTRFLQEAEKARIQAKKMFEESAEIGKDFDRVRALMNLNTVLIKLESSDTNQILSNWQEVRALLDTLPDSREKSYALTNLGAAQLSLIPNPKDPLLALEAARQVAINIRDQQAESFALGTIGNVYEQLGDYNQAMTFTREAQFLAQQVNAPHSLYRWQWQAGRIHNKTGSNSEAIIAYTDAITTLQKIRGDIVSANQDLQFDFRDSVEPVYRELIGLLLEPQTVAISNNKSEKNQAQTQQSPIKSQQNSQQNSQPKLQQVLDTLELLKLAELQNFFGDDCVEVVAKEKTGEEALQGKNTALIYSVVLEDRTELIMRAPDGNLTNYKIPIVKSDLDRKINDLRFFLELRITEQYLLGSQEIYNLLISPIETDLAAMNPDEIVFINDGPLRKIPMSALSDGKEFLIEKYAIATTPSLTLTSTKTLDRKNISVLSLGLTVARPPFAPLSNVRKEVEAVEGILGGVGLIDEEFTINNFQQQVQKTTFPVVHLATHGKFGVDADSTFLLGFDERITIEELDNLLRSRTNSNPVELITLSACQTAAGDDRSALGIAGVAVRAGVETALATLWYINDEATVPLITEFYQQLRNPEISKAEALRRAQKIMIEDPNYNHPAVWSPFILIGNWF